MMREEEKGVPTALTTPPTPHEFVKNPLIPFPSCQVCMGPENAEAHSPPTPDRIRKDAVREALERISKLTPFSANAATAEDFAATVHAIADTALSATPAQEGDEAFCATVWDALKGDHTDLRRQQIILTAHRIATGREGEV